MDFDVLFKGDWIQVVTPKENKYETVHEKDVIMVLPLIISKDKKKVFLAMRKEFCPPYLIKDKSSQLYYTVISGTMEDGEIPVNTMIREIKEETGLDVKSYKILINKENIPVCKSTDMRAHLFVIALEDFDTVKALGDGTVFEAKSKTVFVELSKIDSILNRPNIDYLLYSGIYIVKSLL
jgi:8-oxo-dGTP pyrophosphatase MutT (NUDIX family)